MDLVDAGDPVELAARYDAEGADELVFLDITASSDERDTMVDVVARTAEQVFIPFTVGGGVRSAEDARRLLRAGADKVALNTAALADPELVAELADEFGAQCVVVAIDARARPDGRGLGGLHPRRAPGRPGVDAVAWAGAVRRRWGPGRSSSPPWTATGPGDGFDLDSPGPWSTPWACRWWPRGASAPSSTWWRGPRRRGRRRAGRVDLPPARAHRGRGQGATWRPTAWRCGRSP